MKKMTQYEFLEASKLSDILRIAINDMRSLDRDKFEPDSAKWCSPEMTDSGELDKCLVCLAGAVIAVGVSNGVLGGGLPVSEKFLPAHFDLKTQQKLLALDWLRAGLVGDAFRSVKRPVPNTLPWQVRIENMYFDTWEQADKFLEEMELLQAMLHNAGE